MYIILYFITLHQPTFQNRVVLIAPPIVIIKSCFFSFSLLPYSLHNRLPTHFPVVVQGNTKSDQQ